MTEVSTIPLFSVNKIGNCIVRTCVTAVYVMQSGKGQIFEILIELMF